MSARFPFPIPDGRFAVAWSSDLAPGLGIMRVSGIADMCFLAMNTPIDAEHLQLRWSFRVPKTGDSEKAEGVGRAFMNEFMRQLEQDRPIWENKRCEARLRLCDGDGPISEYRKWASPFHSARPNADGRVAAPRIAR